MDDKLEKDTVLTSLQQPLSPGIEEEWFGEVVQNYYFFFFFIVLQKLITGTVQMLEKQLAPYLVGTLSNPIPDQLTQTKSAPIYIIMAEQIFGLTDHQCRRAPNATIGFIDGKVKAKKNIIRPSSGLTARTNMSRRR